MKEGTLFLVTKFPQPWPVAKRSVLMQQQKGDLSLTLLALPSGGLEFKVIAGGAVNAEIETIPLDIQGTGMALVQLLWGKETRSLSINGREIPLASSKLVPPHVVTLSNTTVPNVLSFSDPNADMACKTWINWRTRRYSVEKVAKKKRRLKTLEQQFGELISALASLRDLSLLVSQGKHYLAGHLAAELRALIYWKESKSNYSPLLIRIAGRLGLPLPIYFFGEREFPPTGVPEPAMAYTTNAASLIKTLPKQMVGDFQEWLSSLVFVVHVDMENRDSDAIERISAKELILHIAAVHGAAHYDDDMPLSSEVVFGLYGPERQQIIDFLLQCSNLVVNLGKFVLHEAQQKGAWKKENEVSSPSI